MDRGLYQSEERRDKEGKTDTVSNIKAANKARAEANRQAKEKSGVTQRPPKTPPS
jgi:hypothetical protein